MALLLSAMAYQNIYAQVGTPTIIPANPGDIMTTTNEGYLNSAIIDYTGSCAGPCVSPNPQLIAITSSYSGTPSNLVQLYLDDGVSNYTLVFPGEAADVIIGHQIISGFPTGDFLVGVVYSLPSPNACYIYNDIYLDIYDVSGVGTGVMTATFVSSTIVNKPLGIAHNVAHIDAITNYYQYPTFSWGGLPLINDFAISYTSEVQNLPYLFYPPNLCLYIPATPSNVEYGVNIAFGSLNGSTSFIYSNNNNVPLGVPALNADVTAVQRYEFGTLYQAAMFTYTDVNGDLWEEELINPASFSIPRKFLGHNMGSMPRIDGIDNYNSNYNGTLPEYNFDFVVTDNDNSNRTIVSPGYSLSLASPTVYSGWAPPLPDWYPVVACGAKNYTIGFFHEDGVNNILTAPPLDWSISLYTGIPPVQYYATNYNPTLSTNHFISLSTTANNDGTLSSYSITNTPLILACWNYGIVNYKVAQDVYSWKHNPADVKTIKYDKEWKLSPNPASDFINIINDAKQGIYYYQLCDNFGKELITGELNSYSQKIDVKNLASGIYWVKIMDENKSQIVILKLIKQ